MTIVVAVVRHNDGGCYVVRAEVAHGARRVVWRVASGLCDGREFVTTPLLDGDVEGALQQALGHDWSVRLAGEVGPRPLLQP